MNISPHVNPIPIATAVNQPTDSLRHENNNRPIITAPSSAGGAAAEKGASEKNKSPGSLNEHNQLELQKYIDKNSRLTQGGSGQTAQDNPQSNEGETSPEQNTHNASNNVDSVDNQTFENTEPKNEESAQAKNDEKMIQELKLRDQEVRAHEQAHAVRGGATTGAPSYEFQIGPDGKKYAVGGEVSVDLSPVAGDPKATIAKMEQVHAAALAPNEPSTQDIKVAARATEIKLQAQLELASLKKEQEEKGSEQTGQASLSNMQSKTFDEKINATLHAQDKIVPSIPNEVRERAQRIQGLYSNITHAHEKQASHQFELIA